MAMFIACDGKLPNVACVFVSAATLLIKNDIPEFYKNFDRCAYQLTWEQGEDALQFLNVFSVCDPRIQQFHLSISYVIRLFLTFFKNNWGMSKTTMNYVLSMNCIY